MPDVAVYERLPVSQAKAGNADAWAALFQRYRLPLYVCVFEMVHSEQASFDIVQETLVSAVRHLGALEDEEKFGGWLFGIAHQKCIQLWRKQKREDAMLKETAEAPVEFEEDPSEKLIRREQEAEFMKLIDTLPLPQRSALLLYYIEEFSIWEIATITETSEGTVKSRLHYAKKTLKNLWKEKAQ